MKWFTFVRGTRRSVAKRSRVNNQRFKTHRPRFDALEERLPPGDTVLGAMLLSLLTEPYSPNRGLVVAAENGYHDELPAIHRQMHSGVGLSQESSRIGTSRPAVDVPVAGRAMPPQFASENAAAWSETPVWAALGDSWQETRSPRRLSLGSSEPWFVTVQSRGSGAFDNSAIGAPLAPSSDIDLVMTAAAIAPGNITPPSAASQHFVNFQSPSIKPDQEGEDLAAADPTLADPKTPPVHALFDLSKPTTGPFPSNHFTVADDTQNTGRRVNLPLPDPNTHPSDFEDTQVLNTLDGFNMQPRLSIPFDGPIDVNTVTSKDVLLISLGDTLPGGDPGGEVVGINQVVWDPPSQTLHVESDELLTQHTRYGLIVTQEIHDTSGHQVKASQEFKHFVHHGQGEYHEAIVQAIQAAGDIGIPQHAIVTASVFSTESATAILEKIRDQIHDATPAPADFNLGQDGERTVFNRSDVTGIHWEQQTGDNPPSFTPTNLNLTPLDIFPGAVGELAFGKYLSPDYEVHPGEYIPPVGTLSGTPVVQGVNEVYFNLFLPSGPKPESGWPVAIFGHGSTSNKNVTPLPVIATMAAHGIATVAINVPGNGFGRLGTLTVNQTMADPVTFSAGGRGIDQNGDHIIGNNEGQFATAPQKIVSSRDGQRQTVVDLMQLVRVIEVGMDVNGEGSQDLDPSRIYYFGQSLGGMYGTDFLAVEPSVRAGVPNVPGGPVIEWNRLSSNRGNVGSLLASRTPSLLNSPGVTLLDGVSVGSPLFNENMPLRNGIPLAVRLEDGTDHIIQSPVINTVAGAMAIQEVIDNTEWVSQSGNPVAYAPHLRKDPLAGVPAKSVIIQFAKGDQLVPNPTTTALLRAGDLADRATYYRNDLASADDPTLSNNPHGFMVGIPAITAITLAAQEQIATFFASDGTVIIHPEPAKYFEVPINLPLPEELNYIP